MLNRFRYYTNTHKNVDVKTFKMQKKKKKKIKRFKAYKLLKQYNIYIYIYMTTQKRNIKEGWTTLKRISHSYSCWNMQDSFNYYKKWTKKFGSSNFHWEDSMHRNYPKKNKKYMTTQ